MHSALVWFFMFYILKRDIFNQFFLTFKQFEKNNLCSAAVKNERKIVM